MMLPCIIANAIWGAVDDQTAQLLPLVAMHPLGTESVILVLEIILFTVCSLKTWVQARTDCGGQDQGIFK